MLPNKSPFQRAAGLSLACALLTSLSCDRGNREARHDSPSNAPAPPAKANRPGSELPFGDPDAKFRELDKDSDHRLTREEFANFQVLKSPANQEAYAFERADSNRDGGVTPEEFRMTIAKTPPLPGSSPAEATAPAR